MNLFNKDKELILKITNAGLLVWFVGALIFTFSSGIELFMKEPTRDSSIIDCEKKCIDGENQEKCCDVDDNYNEEIDNFYKRRSLYVSLANVVIVGTTLVILNKEKTKSKK